MSLKKYRVTLRHGNIFGSDRGFVWIENNIIKKLERFAHIDPDCGFTEENHVGRPASRLSMYNLEFVKDCRPIEAAIIEVERMRERTWKNYKELSHTPVGDCDTKDLVAILRFEGELVAYDKTLVAMNFINSSQE